ncbi:RES family NAD+ phosphorylase [Amphritea pacifica]|uniref:RES family NAD+ phosphorylase n=1 Tax=Amphritea pacifica TaxID=2811233 RepID=UPI00196376EA|nr:RES family NAD+ phosphorylase [Amphritea pacifica]MBN1008479.1 RES family NAD+ phosphorylase [Amphritea pacifica]
MIWQACQGAEQIRPISGTLFRLVESQEQVATTGYVNTLEEQAILEELLELSKPGYPTASPEEITSELHYLLKTPFRYPPLAWGSRFGRQHEPGLFYGGESLEATLAESAYYRFVFLLSMEGEPPGTRLCTEHTLFTIGYRAQRGIQLQHSPFDNYTDQLTHPRDYTATQALGAAMREAGVEAFQYRSARSIQSGLCAALYTAALFTSNQPDTTAQWLCELTATGVTFKAVASPQTWHYPLSQFKVDGEFPLPA